MVARMIPTGERLLQTTLGKPNVVAWILRVLVAVVATTVLGFLGHERLIDGDEGFYLMAARLVSEGKRLYSDFFFPQMPFLGWIYGAWFWLTGRSWYGARLLCSLLAAGTGLMVFELVLRTTRRKALALVAAALYLASGSVGGWFVVAKSFAPTIFLLTAGVLLLETAQAPLRAALGGLALGLAVECRLYVIVVLPCAALFLLRRYGLSRQGLRFLLALAGGCLAATVVLLPYIIRDWHNFYFDNWTFHSIREFEQTGFFTNLENKKSVVRTVLALEPGRLPGNVQFLGLAVVAMLALLLPKTRRNRLTSYVWLALFVVSLVPSPTDPQYFCLLIPFMIVEACHALAGRYMPRWWILGPVVAALVAGYTVLGVRDLERYRVTGQAVPGVWTPDRIPRWSIPTIMGVAKIIDDADQREGASWWPGYFVSTKTPLNLMLANDFGFRAAARLTLVERQRVRIMAHDDVVEMMNKKDPPLFVEGNWAARPMADYLPGKGYREVGSLVNVKVWVAR
jgi:4-amino-4-deoxy-L-arabinose transferase-like glycosyltransferase